jgi:FkbM family methyltransferase
MSKSLKLDQVQMIRKFLLPVFSKLNLGNMHITHHYTGEKILIHSFKHKGYWYHGKNRERETMMSFQKLLKQGDTVIEVGGHIGYISLWFSQLVGHQGSVHVFECGENNLPYTRNNISSKPNVMLIEKGAGSKKETMTFYMDSLTGQNNSFLENNSAYMSTKESTFIKKTNMRKVEVNVIPVDDYVKHNNINASLIKIDVESFECEVIKGLTDTLINQKPTLMVEVAPENKEWVYKVMNEYGYESYSPTLEKLSEEICGNVFFIHPQKAAI